MRKWTLAAALVGVTGASSVEAAPLYRMWASGDHFYTMSTEEVAIAAGLGYKLEGDVGQCELSQTLGTIPLYRLWSASATDHFYTTSSQERDLAIAGLGYVSEDVACWVRPTRSIGMCPLYRMYSGNATDHFYTLSWKEVLSAAGMGYSYEGVAAYMGAAECPE
jgi:hypothetical protein